MEFDPHDQDIIGLLAKLKDVPAEYPEKMFVARRQGFLKRITEIELGVRGPEQGGNPAGPTRPPMLSSPTATLLETVIIAVIIVEASLTAYFYRDELTDLVQHLGRDSRAAVLTPAQILPTSSQIQGISPSPALTSTTRAASPTAVMATGTPVPAAAADKNGTPGLTSTPAPKSNEGNHYGQTPKAERTKENSGKGDSKRPTKEKDNKPPKGKPTQTK